MILGSLSTGLCKQILQRSQHERERRAKFVTDVAEKCGFCAINFRQSLGSFLFLFVGAGIRDARGDLSSNQIEEPRITYIERTIRIEPGDENSGGFILHLAGDG